MKKAKAASSEAPKTAFPFVRVLLLLAFLGLIAAVSIAYGPEIVRLMRHPQRFQRFAAAHGAWSALIYVSIQAAHVVILLIPGEITQVAGGYAFGTVLGTLYSTLGILLGTIVVFFGVRLLGYELVRRFLSPKKLAGIETLINSRNSEIVLFLLFLIPGFPKDALVYAAGLMPIHPFKLLLISMIARFPGLLASAYIGAHLQRREYLGAWIIGAVALVLFIAGILAREPLLRRLRRPKRGRPAPRND